MAGAFDIPPGVSRFISAHIRSLEHLELLMLMMQAAERWWDATTAADALGLDPETAHLALDHLASHNLLAIRITGDVRYQFQPGESRLADEARLFAETYRRNRLGVLTQVAQPERRSIRDFADAFRIRRDDDR